jgi:DNA polymerase-3 subunit delta
VPAFKPAYLVHGDDHGRIAERRARLRALAEQEAGAQGLEVFEGDAATPEAVASALSAMTMAFGRRFLIVDGVERWSDKDVEPLLEVLADPPSETTVAFFAREEGRKTAPAALSKAVKNAGGQIAEEKTVKPWELPKWAVARASELGLDLTSAGAKALVARVGNRQQRLLRELERIALELGPGTRLDADDIEELTVASAERRIWSLADALAAHDSEAALRALVELRGQGERVGGLLYSIANRLRQTLDVAQRLEAGESGAQIKSSLPMRGRAADRVIADGRNADPERLRAAIATLADLEMASRGGAPHRGLLTEDTLAVRAVLDMAG